MLLLGAGGGGAAGRPARTELNILTGPESGTYFAVAKDLKRLAEEVVPEAGVDLDVVPSQGALQNALEVFRYRSIPLGITQLDIVAYLSIYGRGNDEARRVAEGLQVVLPLYQEEVHLLARGPVKSLASLTDKRVSIGPPGSGTHVTAMVLLHLAGVHPADVLTLDFSDALAALRRGQLDALFLVGGAPVPALAAEVMASDGLALVPVRLQPVSDEAPLAAYYLPARQSVALDTPDCARSPGSPPALPGDSRSETRSSSRSKRPGPSLVARTYPWQPEPVGTVAVWSGIVTSGTEGCEAIGALARMSIDHLGWLRANGHPKWQSVALDDARLRALPRLSSCVARRLAP